MQNETVPVTCVNGGYDERLTCLDKANVADEGVVDDAVNRIPVVCGPFRDALDTVQLGLFK